MLSRQIQRAPHFSEPPLAGRFNLLPACRWWPNTNLDPGHLLQTYRPMETCVSPDDYVCLHCKHVMLCQNRAGWYSPNLPQHSLIVRHLKRRPRVYILDSNCGITVFADVLAPNGSRPSTGTMITFNQLSLTCGDSLKILYLGDVIQNGRRDLDKSRSIWLLTDVTIAS